MLLHSFYKTGQNIKITMPVLISIILVSILTETRNVYEMATDTCNKNQNNNNKNKNNNYDDD